MFDSATIKEAEASDFKMLLVDSPRKSNDIEPEIVVKEQKNVANNNTQLEPEDEEDNLAKDIFQKI